MSLVESLSNREHDLIKFAILTWGIMPTGRTTALNFKKDFFFFFLVKFIRKRLRGKIWKQTFMNSAKEPLSNIPLGKELEPWKYQQFPKGYTVSCAVSAHKWLHLRQPHCGTGISVDLKESLLQLNTIALTQCVIRECSSFLLLDKGTVMSSFKTISEGSCTVSPL